MKTPQITERTLLIDATDAPLGRLASFAAKQALLAKSIIITNCNNAIISGEKSSIVRSYKKERARGGSSLKGPNISKMPQKIVKRTIRGMLPYKEGRGAIALKNVICYNETPEEYKNANKVTLKKIFHSKTLQLKELSRIV